MVAIVTSNSINVKAPFRFMFHSLMSAERKKGTIFFCNPGVLSMGFLRVLLGSSEKRRGGRIELFDFISHLPRQRIVVVFQLHVRAV